MKTEHINPNVTFDVTGWNASQTVEDSKHRTSIVCVRAALAMKANEVWNAVMKGDMEKLRKLTHATAPRPDFGKRVDNHHWNILHHAVVSRNLDCVKLVVDHFHPPTDVQCYEGFTPLARACEQSVPAEIVSYLLRLDRGVVNMGDRESITPLHYAVSNDRLDLVELLIANGADVTINDYADETALHTAAFDTGNIEILIYLLFIAKAKWQFLAAADDFNGIDIFSARGPDTVRNKVACFKILYNLEHPNHMYRQRYNVNDILKPALLSYRSQSCLIPYFIETELKWEKQEHVRSLYERLIPDYQLLAMLVLCECGPVTAERSELEYTWPQVCSVTLLTADMIRLFTQFIKGDEKRSTEEISKLLEDFAEFSQATLNVMKQTVKALLPTLVTEVHALEGLRFNSVLYDQYERAIDLLAVMHNGTELDSLVKRLLTEIEAEKLDMIFPCLKYCSYGFLARRVNDALPRNPLYQWVLHRFGTWRAISSIIGRPQFELFSLKRLARDAVRAVAWRNMNRLVPDRVRSINTRLESLDIPTEMKLCLLYRDNSSKMLFA
uniref:ANK_REP_REGION domain-containing protein n=1 Tax=Anopheles epiroticus TaxID=199890 RepID=A0A182P320_9DIPT